MDLSTPSLPPGTGELQGHQSLWPCLALWGQLNRPELQVCCSQVCSSFLFPGQTKMKTASEQIVLCPDPTSELCSLEEGLHFCAGFIICNMELTTAARQGGERTTGSVGHPDVFTEWWAGPAFLPRPTLTVSGFSSGSSPLCCFNPNYYFSYTE